jgi:hypothetical protein
MIHHQVLQPKTRSFSNSRELRGLFQGELSQIANGLPQSSPDHFQPTLDEDEIGVVCDETGGGPEMQNPAGLRARLSERMHVCHYIMAEALLMVGGTLKIDIISGSTESG